MSRHVLLSLALGAVLAGSMQVHGAAFRATAFPTPDPNAVVQNVATPATQCNETTHMAGIYPCHKIDLQYFMPLADLGCGSAAVVWGWTDPSTQKEYALFTCNTGVSFVDVTTPTAPVYLGRLPGHSANSLWRDVKVYQHYAYVGSESSGHGLQIFDLHRLRNVMNPPVVFTEDGWYNGFTRSHTIWVNESTGFLYAAGSAEGSQTCGGDLHMVSLANPLVPTFAGCLGRNGYVHEAQCVVYTGPDTEHQGKEICFTSNGRFDNTDTLGIDDVTVKNNVQQLARVAYPSVGYTHQTNITEDQQYMLMDDEFDEQDFGFPSRTLVWDIRDLDNPIFMGAHLGATSAVDHNQYIRGGYAFQSNYRAGLRILDLKNLATFPSTPMSEYGYFDIYPSDNVADYNGSWCNYPYFASGNVVVSGIEQGLFILKPIFLPKVSVNDIAVVEGTGGTRNVTFTVSLTAPTDRNVIVSYSTSDGTATAGQDYPASSGSIIIPAGATTKTKQIGVIGDAVQENDETFFLNLSTPIGAEMQDAQGMATIIDDDTPVPTITMNDSAINEGDDGTANATFTLTLTPATAQNVTVDWATGDGTAFAGEDYSSASGTALTFTGGTATISVPISGDMTIEPNETFVVNLSNPSGAILGRTQATVTITNDDILALTAVAPTSGPSAGGSVVNVTGTRFSDGVAVHFGAADATDVVVIDQAHLTATTPAMPAGSLVGMAIHPPGAAPVAMHPPQLMFFSDFLDVPAGHLFHSYIETIVRLAITSGCGGGNYCPDAAANRAQMAVLLLRSKFGGTYVPGPAVGLFSDVPASSPFAPWIEDLYNKGITSGCSSAPLRYCPSDAVTRAQMAVFLLRTKEGSAYQPPAATGIFDDVPITHPFAAFIEELANRAITSGCGGNNYCPSDSALRSQMAAFLTRTFALQ